MLLFVLLLYTYIPSPPYPLLSPYFHDQDIIYIFHTPSPRPPYPLFLHILITEKLFIIFAPFFLRTLPFRLVVYIFLFLYFFFSRHHIFIIKDLLLFSPSSPPPTVLMLDAKFLPPLDRACALCWVLNSSFTFFSPLLRPPLKVIIIHHNTNFYFNDVYLYLLRCVLF